MITKSIINSIVLITVQTGVLMTVQTSVLMTVQTSVLITVQTSVVMTVQTNVLTLSLRKNAASVPLTFSNWQKNGASVPEKSLLL